MVGLFLWSGNGFDTVFIDIPEVAADGAVAHTAEELHVGLHLEYIVGAWFAEFEIDDYGMAVFGHDAVGAAGYDLPAVRLPAEDAAFAKEGPRTVEPVAYLFVLPATLNDGAYVLQLTVVFNEPLLKECLQHLWGIIGRIDFGIDFVEQVALSDVLPAVVGISSRAWRNSADWLDWRNTSRSLWGANEAKRSRRGSLKRLSQRRGLSDSAEDGRKGCPQVYIIGSEASAGC